MGSAEASRELQRPLHIIKIELTKAYDKVTEEELMRGAHGRQASSKLAKAFVRTMLEKSVRFGALDSENTVHQVAQGMGLGLPGVSLAVHHGARDGGGLLSRRWQDRGIGLVRGSTSMLAMTFANDLCPLGRSKQEADIIVGDLVRALDSHGLALQPAKRVGSQCTMIPGTRNPRESGS